MPMMAPVDIEEPLVEALEDPVAMALLVVLLVVLDEARGGCGSKALAIEATLDSVPWIKLA